MGKLLREDSEVSEYYNANYISYAMNTYNELPAQEHAFLKNAHLNFNSVPVLLYFDKDKKFLHYSTPEINAEFIISEGKKALFPAFNAAGLKSKYEAGDRTVRTLYAFSSFLVIQENTQLLNKVTQELYDSFRKGELPTKKSYIILKNVVQSSDNGFFQYWINNLSGLTGFESGIKSGTEFSYLQTIVLKEVSDPNSKNWDEAKKNKYKEYIVKLKMSENPDVFFEIL